MDKVDLIMERYLGEIFGLSQKERDEKKAKQNEPIKKKIIELQKKIERKKVVYQKAEEHWKSIKDDKQADEYADSHLSLIKTNLKLAQEELASLRSKLKK